MAPDARKQDVAADEHQERCQALMDFVVNINDEDVPVHRMPHRHMVRIHYISEYYLNVYITVS